MSDCQAGNPTVQVVVTFGLDLDMDGLVKAGGKWSIAARSQPTR